MTIAVGTNGNESEDQTPLYRLKRHTKAVRENSDLVAAILGFLLEEPPNASAAQEILELAPHDVQIDLWSCSPTAGGIWTTWMRDALKYGTTERTNSYDVWLARTGRPPAEIKGIEKMPAVENTVRTETPAQYPDKWIPTGEFVRDYPELARTPKSAHNLSAKRFRNGMDEMNVVKKKRGFGLRWNPANFARWIAEYRS